MRHAAPLLIVTLLASPVAACSFCTSGADKPTLREIVGRSGVILVGRAGVATINPDGSDPYTEFVPATAIKGKSRGAIKLRRYLPGNEGQSQKLIVFAKSADSLADPELILPATEGLQRVVGELTVSPAESKLAFAFTHLDDADAAVRADSFAEFARATDAEVLAAKGNFDPAKPRKLLAEGDANRAGVFAVLLGHCARPGDAAFLESLLDKAGPSTGGVLAGLTLADSKRGWGRIRATATDPKRSYAERFAAVNAARFVRRCRPKEQAEATALALALLDVPELADAAVEDLREWKCWDATPQVLRAAHAPTHQGRLVKRAFVRFALASPDPLAKAYVAEVRRADPGLVAGVAAADSP